MDNTMDNREQHLLKVYDIIKRTINGGLFVKMKELLERRDKMEKEDIANEIFCDYIQYYDPEKFDPSKSALRSYVNGFVKLRLRYYVRKNNAVIRKIESNIGSIDQLREEVGFEPSIPIDDEPDKEVWDMFADFIEEHPKAWRGKMSSKALTKYKMDRLRSELKEISNNQMCDEEIEIYLSYIENK